MSDALALPPIADPTLMGSPMALSMKMGPGGDIDKTAEEFEAMFATQLLQPMFEGIGVNPTFGGGHGEEMMRSFLMQEYGKLIAKSGKLGIATQVKTEMLRAQEGSNGRTSGSSRAAGARRNPYVAAMQAGNTGKEGLNVSVQ
jgi:flagellar protein FlgJ